MSMTQHIPTNQVIDIIQEISNEDINTLSIDDISDELRSNHSKGAIDQIRDNFLNEINAASSATKLNIEKLNNHSLQPGDAIALQKNFVKYTTEVGLAAKVVGITTKGFNELLHTQ